MNIGLISREYPPDTASGGIGTQTYIKAHGLSRLGHTVCVITESVDSTTQRFMDDKVQVVRVGSLSDRLALYTEPAEWIARSFTVAIALEGLTKEFQFDLLDFPEWGAEAYVYLLNRTEWNSVPVVLQLHGPLVMFGNAIGWPSLDSEFYRTGTAIEGTCLRLADRIFSSSACSAEWCVRHYSISQAIPVLHTGVDLSCFLPQPVAKSARPTIAFAGRITDDKGARGLVLAACAVAKEVPDLRVRMMGRGDPALINDLRGIATRDGHPDLIEMKGFVSSRDLAKEFSTAHLFVLPSLHEPGPGLVYLEAMACGLPVIGCSGAGAAEVVRDGLNGLLVPPGNVTELAEAIKRILLDSPLREELSRGALEYARGEADSITCLKRIEDFYRETVEAFGRAR